MEWDPDSNIYSSNGPQARAKKTQDTVRRGANTVVSALLPGDLEQRAGRVDHNQLWAPLLSPSSF